jgi:uncharacterized protein YecE (DUF72 family)
MSVYLRNRSRQCSRKALMACRKPVGHEFASGRVMSTSDGSAIVGGSEADRTKLMAGTSGLVLPVPNKQAFPPEFRNRSRLAYYASLFDSLEVNSSFYKVPMPVTFSKWADEVPPGFRFTVKLWQGITHVTDLRFLPVDVNRFLYAADQLGSKKGCLLIQLPPGLKAHRIDQLDRLLEKICVADAGHAWKLAVEFRNRGWYTPAVEKMLERYQAVKVLQDMPASGIAEHSGNQGSDSPPFVYLRFHGPNGDYKGGYSDFVLHAWAQKIRGWLQSGKEVYAYFNNTIGDALKDLNTLISSSSTDGARL